MSKKPVAAAAIVMMACAGLGFWLGLLVGWLL